MVTNEDVANWLEEMANTMLDTHSDDSTLEEEFTLSSFEGRELKLFVNGDFSSVDK